MQQCISRTIQNCSGSHSLELLKLRFDLKRHLRDVFRREIYHCSCRVDHFSGCMFYHKQRGDNQVDCGCIFLVWALVGGFFWDISVRCAAFFNTRFGCRKNLPIRASLSGMSFCVQNKPHEDASFIQIRHQTQIAVILLQLRTYHLVTSTESAFEPVDKYNLDIQVSRQYLVVLQLCLLNQQWFFFWKITS